MKLKNLKKKVRRLEARLRQGPKKLAKLKRKLDALEAAKKRKAQKKAAARAVARQTAPVFAGNEKENDGPGRGEETGRCREEKEKAQYFTRTPRSALGRNEGAMGCQEGCRGPSGSARRDDQRLGSRSLFHSLAASDCLPGRRVAWRPGSSHDLDPVALGGVAPGRLHRCRRGRRWSDFDSRHAHSAPGGAGRDDSRHEQVRLLRRDNDRGAALRTACRDGLVDGSARGR